MKLNLGCGQNKQEGYVNVDKYGSFAPDVVWNLESFPWPFESNSVDEIVMHHSLEHMGESVEMFLGIMKELYRISAPGGKVFITVPHPRSDGFAGDPTHVRAINPAILSLFSKKKNREWKELGWPNTPLATYIDVDFDMSDLRHSLMPHWAEQLRTGEITNKALDFAASSYYNVVSDVQMTLVACK